MWRHRGGKNSFTLNDEVITKIATTEASSNYYGKVNNTMYLQNVHV
jgi:hypothetical protein